MFESQGGFGPWAKRIRCLAASNFEIGVEEKKAMRQNCKTRYYRTELSAKPIN